MIVLVEHTLQWGEGRLTREMVAANLQRLRAQYAMPMSTQPAPRLASTRDACRAYVAARVHDPRRADLLLRNLRRRAFSDEQPLDDPETISDAAGDAGIAPERISAWRKDDTVEAALRDDMAATRSPLPEALALAHRLSRSNGGFRYSTASAVFEAGPRRIVMPGFQPFAVYEVSMANVASDVERRPPPESAHEVLSWAPYPLATAEVAELRQVSVDEARRELEEAGAEFAPVAGDGYWSAA
jgi:hypothetical protein